MKRPYLIGLAASALIAIVQLAIKLSYSRGPGLGDFLIIGAIPEPIRFKLGEWFNYSDALIYVYKALAAMIIYSFFYLVLKRTGRARLFIALALTTVLLLLMSLGKVVFA